MIKLQDLIKETTGDINNWKSTNIKIQGEEFIFYKNPSFKKPPGGVNYYHDTNEEHIDSIMKTGSDATLAGSVWFNDEKTFKGGVRSGYKAGYTFIASIPEEEFMFTDQLEKSDEGVEVTESIPVEWIQGLLYQG